MDASTIYGFGIFGIIALVFILIAVIVGFTIIYKVSILQGISLTMRSIQGGILSLFYNNNPINSDVCSVIPGSIESINRVPSYYLAHIAFFFGFVLMNAVAVYIMPKDTKLSDSYYENRRNRALMTMVLLSVLFVGLIVFRLKTTSCESLLGVLFTTCAFGSIGVGWYKFAETCGTRTADILGIAPAIVPKSAVPIVCASAPDSASAPAT